MLSKTARAVPSAWARPAPQQGVPGQTGTRAWIFEKNRLPLGKCGKTTFLFPSFFLRLSPSGDEKKFGNRFAASVGCSKCGRRAGEYVHTQKPLTTDWGLVKVRPDCIVPLATAPRPRFARSHDGASRRVRRRDGKNWRATDPGTGGRPAQDLAGDQPRNWRATDPRTLIPDNLQSEKRV